MDAMHQTSGLRKVWDNTITAEIQNKNITQSGASQHQPELLKRAHPEQPASRSGGAQINANNILQSLI